MASAQLTEEKANSKYQEGYNDGRYGSGGDFLDEIFESSGFGRASACRSIYNRSSGRRHSSRSASVLLSACRAGLLFTLAILSLSIKKVLTNLCVLFKIDNCVGTPSSSSKPP